MTTRTFTGRGGETWEWEETPETIKAVKDLHESTRRVNESSKTNANPKFAGNYKGPLYAPHPELKKPKRIVESSKVVITEKEGNE